MMLALASLALVLGLKAMVTRADRARPQAAPVVRACAAVPALPGRPDLPDGARAPRRTDGQPGLQRADARPAAWAAWVGPAVTGPYYRVAFAAFHLSDSAG